MDKLRWSNEETQRTLDRMSNARKCLPALILLMSCSFLDRDRVFETEHGTVRAVTVARGLSHPWGMVFLPDGRMLVTERRGDLRIVDQEGTVSEPLDGVPEVYAKGQGGLLGLALAEDFAATGRLFISFAEPGDDDLGGTATFRATFTEAALTDVEIIFRQARMNRAGQHFGSRVVIARDQNLFITTGERGDAPESQRMTRTKGKVVRVRPDGSIPQDNPFVGRGDTLPEIWSYGHRNIQGAALHPETGELWTVEHGARGGDEVNRPEAGRNYGWPIISYGTHYNGSKIGDGTSAEGMEQPLHYWDPSIAPSGLIFYTGDLFPRWRGNIFVGSLKFGTLSRLEMDGDRVVKEERMLEGFNDRIRDVVQGPDGFIYLLTDERSGRIVRLEPGERPDS
jgi:glucose/arabinose dehydrogenase